MRHLALLLSVPGALAMMAACGGGLDAARADLVKMKAQAGEIDAQYVNDALEFLDEGVSAGKVDAGEVAEFRRAVDRAFADEQVSDAEDMELATLADKLLAD